MRSEHPYKIVVIGGSLGGFDAVIEILSYLTVGFPIPIVIVLHRLRNSKSTLADLIDKKVNIKVKEVDEKELLLPGTAYISPANYHILLEKDGSISLDSSELIHYSRPSIDILFQSAARAYQEQVIGIILTGANQDGSEGLKDIEASGGLAIIENPINAMSNTMPNAAIKNTKRPKVLALDEIGKFLKELE